MGLPQAKRDLGRNSKALKPKLAPPGSGNISGNKEIVCEVNF